MTGRSAYVADLAKRYHDAWVLAHGQSATPSVINAIRYLQITEASAFCSPCLIEELSHLTNEESDTILGHINLMASLAAESCPPSKSPKAEVSAHKPYFANGDEIKIRNNGWDLYRPQPQNSFPSAKAVGDSADRSAMTDRSGPSSPRVRGAIRGPAGPLLQLCKEFWRDCAPILAILFFTFVFGLVVGRSVELEHQTQIAQGANL